MSKKEEKLKAVTVNEKLMEIYNKDIVKALALSYADEVEKEFYFSDLQQQIKLIENNDPDLKYIASTGNASAMTEYALSRRNMVCNAYSNYISDEITRTATCILLNINSGLSDILEKDQSKYYCSLYLDEIANILMSTFNSHPLRYAFGDESSEYISDIMMINNNIPNTCIKLNSYLKQNIFKSLNYEVENREETKDLLDKQNKIINLIENITFSTQSALIATYSILKNYAENVSLPAGFPNITLELCNEGDGIITIEEAE